MVDQPSYEKSGTRCRFLFWHPEYEFLLWITDNLRLLLVEKNIEGKIMDQRTHIITPFLSMGFRIEKKVVFWYKYKYSCLL